MAVVLYFLEQYSKQDKYPKDLLSKNKRDQICDCKDQEIVQMADPQTFAKQAQKV